MSHSSRALLVASTLLALSACTGPKVSMEDDDLLEASRTDQPVDEVAAVTADETVAELTEEEDGERYRESDRRQAGKDDAAHDAGGALDGRLAAGTTGGSGRNGLASLGYVGGDADAPMPDVVAEADPAPEAEPLVRDAYDDLDFAAPITVTESRPAKMKALEIRSRGPKAEQKASGASSAAPPAPPVDAFLVTTPGVLGGSLADDQTREDNNREGYTHYGINDMQLVEGDRFSTFSIDVDTASYSIARRKLNEGWMPNTAGVRVEEFVNALHYDYAAPKAKAGGAPFAVHMEAAPSPFQQNHHILRVGVQGAEIDQETRAPMHLTFLVDTSGSMNSPDKLGLAKTALHEVVDNLGPEDTIALATYAGSSTIVLPATGANNKAAIHKGIDSLTSGGGTHMDSGMNLAYELASGTYLYGAENRVVVLSDGDANIGRTSHDEILRTIQHYAEEGITLSTIGFGMGNYQDTMMEQLANKGDGNYFYIDTAKEAQKVFGQDLAATTQVIAKDVKIQVEFNPDAVTAYRLIGYENRDIADVDFRNDRVDAGEIGSGHAVTALYDVVLRDDAASQELATVRIRAKKPGPDSAAKEWATLMSGDLLASEFSDASNDFRLAFATASFAELLRGSPYLAEVSYQDVLAIARSADRNRDEDAELIGLIATAGNLSGERGPVAGR